MKLGERIVRTTAHNLFILGTAGFASALMSTVVLPYLVSRGIVIPVVNMERP